MGRYQRLVLLVSILASFVAFLDGSVVNVALPAIADELKGGLALQQWVIDVYLITLGALMLVAGSISDLYGRVKMLRLGLLGFAVASILCAVAPNGLFLIVSRALQGIAGALLVPSSLALIISSFEGSAQGKAIGTWTAWTGIAFIVGPLVGGSLVDLVSWRLIFAINTVPIAITLWLMRPLNEVGVGQQQTGIDYLGAVLCSIGLGGPVYSLIEQAQYGWSSPLIILPLVIGSIALMAFILHEQKTLHPMLPLSLFKNRNFSVGNLATMMIYAGLSLSGFLITVFVQQVGGYTATAAGLALLPVTLIMFVLSSRFGALAGVYGPRLFMAIGPIIAATGFLLMLSATNEALYWQHLLPGILLFGLGLSITVAPLTSAILGFIDKQEAGIASAVNNAVARIAGLVAIAALALVTGPVLDLAGFKRGLIFTATLLVIGGAISAIGIQNAKHRIASE